MRNKKSSILTQIAIAGMLAGLLLGGANVYGTTTVAQPDLSAPDYRGQLQFIAKMYTEALGRAPTPGEWQTWYDYFFDPADPHSCDSAILKGIVEEMYTGSDFILLGYNRASALLALFRGALNHEPDASGFNYYYRGAGAGLTWPDTVHDLLYNYTHTGYPAEFDALVTNSTYGICKPGGNPPFYEGAPYGWDEISPKHPVLDIPDLAYSQPSRSQAELQAELDAAALPTATTHIVELLQTETITINGSSPNNPLTIPKGVTLKTQGDPPPGRYAQMGRLVRVNAATRTWSVVVLQAGSTLSNVWVDGQRSIIGGPSTSGFADVAILDDGQPPASITQTQVIANRLSDTIGDSLAHAWGPIEGWPCGNIYIGANLLTQYANNHYSSNSEWADGVATSCMSTTVESNTLVDITDGGVVVFRAGIGVVQSSKVRNNVMLNAGNSAYGGIGVDPIFPEPCEQQDIREFDFSGTEISGNVLWTSPTAHIDVTLYGGTYAWKFELCAYHNTGRGVHFLDNATGDSQGCPSCIVRTNNPVIISGMFDAMVGCNPLSVNIEELIECPHPQPGERMVFASVGEGSASFQPPQPLFTDVKTTDCVSHRANPVALSPQVIMIPCFWTFVPLAYKGATAALAAGVAEGGFEACLLPTCPAAAGRQPGQRAR